MVYSLQSLKAYLKSFLRQVKSRLSQFSQRPTMYCPSCLNSTLSLNHKGVADLIINGKQLDNGKILFNALQMKETETLLEKKISEFFKWHSKFQNIEVIENIEIVSNSFSCSNRCPLKASQKFSLIGLLFTEDLIWNLAKKIGQEIGLSISRGK
jgi:hypothetical protein